MVTDSMAFLLLKFIPKINFLGGIDLMQKACKYSWSNSKLNIMEILDNH